MAATRPIHAGIALALLFPCPATAQEPKVGSKWYEDEVDLGFKIKAPKDWDFIPPSPLERNLIGKYAPPNTQYVNLGGDAAVFLNVWLVKFDRRPETLAKKEKRQVGDKEVEINVGGGLKDIDEWMSSGIDEGEGWHRAGPAEPLKGAGVLTTVSLYEGSSTSGIPGANPKPIKCYVAEFQLAPDLDVALVGIGPGDGKWRPFEKSFETMARSFQPSAVLKREPAASENPNDPRAQKRAKLQQEIAKSPDWSLHETPSYFIVSSYGDKQFIEELKTRLEGIRVIYESDYPPSKARKMKVEATAEEKPAEQPATAAEDRTTSAVDPMALSRSSVVRVCKDLDQYKQYGGPDGTGGYFNPIEEELVIFDDKQVRGRDFTWAVLSHEAFHQYIYCFYGNLSPHSWYNEGTGDYYYGFDYKNGKFKLGPARNRVEDVQELIASDRYIALQEFVRWPKSKYYGENTGNGRGGRKLEGYECYAQGWSLIWFLRTGAGKAKGWQKSWGTILDTYLEALLDTGDVDKAVDKAFEGVDWDAFEKSWLDYIG